MSMIPYETINLLLEATEECNLRCKYCFHANEGYVKGKMSFDTFQNVCKLVFPHYKKIQLLWHGGEPLCAGIDFFREVMIIQREYQKKYNVEIINSMQTNGTLINDEIASLLSKNDFTVGVSFDGLTNDLTRGNTKKTINGINTLKKHNIKHIGAITVVCGENIDLLPESYQLMKKLNISTDFNSLIMTGGAKSNSGLEMSIDHYCEKMKEFFDIWFFDKDCDIYVNPFVSYIRDSCYNFGSVCWHTSCLGRWINVKPNGNIYPCSREFTSEYSYGNINEIDDIQDLFESNGFYKLLEETVIRRDKCKDLCQWYDYCQGGCSCNALTESGITNNGGFSCLAFKSIFSYVHDNVQKVKEKGRNYIEASINPTVASIIINSL